MSTSKKQYCLETFRCPLAALSLGEEDRRKVVQAMIKESGEGGFADGELAQQADISWAEELLVIGSFGFIMGGPMALFMSGIASMVFGTWRAKAAWLGLSALLAFHPLPRCDERLRKSRLTLAIFKYFSYRFMWSGNAKEELDTCGSWIGVAPPHGVLPLANILSIAAVNTFSFSKFVGAAASVVLHTPFLRYLSLYGIIDVSGQSITKANSNGISVGVVPDGIAGIFRCSSSDEVVVLKTRKGLAKLALKTGHALVPAYSVGNTSVFSAWYDPWGIMESASRKLQAAVFPFWGRAYLPIPRRSNVTMLIGAPLVVKKVDNPTQEQVDELHERLLAEFVLLFDTHKGALGWGDKKIVFE
mmetsp:Transcript_56605/g.104775  ORF Transcript_56605/g.104775 Transcript_56605/m.104775 type:complete len:359 (-) Transcript_56605:96-1172(-)